MATARKKLTPKKKVAPAKKKTVPDEVLVIARKLYKLTMDAMQPLAHYWKSVSAKNKIAIPEPKSNVAKAVVAYLKSNTSAFNCNRLDVIKLLGALTNEPIIKMVPSDPLVDNTSDEEEDCDFVNLFNAIKTAGCVFVMYDKDTVLMSNAEDDMYLELGSIPNSSGFDNYYPNNNKQIRPATLPEIETFIRAVGLLNLKKQLILL